MQKIRKKKVIIQSWEKGVTDPRTDRQSWIHRTLWQSRGSNKGSALDLNLKWQWNPYKKFSVDINIFIFNIVIVIINNKKARLEWLVSSGAHILLDRYSQTNIFLPILFAVQVLNKHRFYTKISKEINFHNVWVNNLGAGKSNFEQNIQKGSEQQLIIIINYTMP